MQSELSIIINEMRDLYVSIIGKMRNSNAFLYAGVHFINCDSRRQNILLSPEPETNVKSTLLIDTRMFDQIRSDRAKCFNLKL